MYKNILLLILIIGISLTAIIVSVESHAFSERSYITSYNKYNLQIPTNKSEKEFIEISNDLIMYMKGYSSEEKLYENFNSREVLHMRDVKDIFSKLKILKYISGVTIITIIFYLHIVKELKKILKKLIIGLNINYMVLMGLLALILSDFNKYFVKFHLIFFDNDLWLLDPKTDLLIQMMPEAFFTDMAIKICITYILLIILVQIVLFTIHKLKLFER